MCEWSNVSGAGQFIGEEGIATGRPRNAHVVAADDVTSLTFSTSASIVVEGPEVQVQPLRTRSLPSGDQIDARVERVHRRLRLRRPQDPSDGRTSLAVPDRSDRCSPRRSSERCSASSTSSRSCRSESSGRHSSRTRPQTARPRVRERARAPLPRRRTSAVEKYRSIRSGRIVPTWWPGPRRAASLRAAAMLSPLDGPMPKPRRPNSRAVAMASDSGTSTGSPSPTATGSRSRLMPSTMPGIPPTTSGSPSASEAGSRHRSSDERVVAVIPQSVRHAHQRAASADTGDEAVEPSADLLDELAARSSVDGRARCAGSRTAGRRTHPSLSPSREAVQRPLRPCPARPG